MQTQFRPDNNSLVDFFGLGRSFFFFFEIPTLIRKRFKILYSIEEITRIYIFNLINNDRFF